jgi:hypothetical protein
MGGMRMPKKEVQKVEATIIDTPTVQTELDKAVSEAEQKAATVRERFMPHEIKDGEDYKQTKRDRAALRREKKEAEDARKGLLGKAKRWIRDKELRFAPAIDAYSAVDDEIKANLTAYEEKEVSTKLGELQAHYNEFAPDLVPLVPFETIDKKYGVEKKWHSVSTNVQKMKGDLDEIVQDIAQCEKTIDSMGYDQQDAQAFKAYYFQSLDFQDAARRAQADKEQRERVEQLERERAERQRLWEEAQKEQEPETQEAEPEPTPEPQAVTEQPQKHETPSNKDTYAFVAYVTKDQLNGLVGYCKAMGIHGKAKNTNGKKYELMEVK